MKTIQRNGSRSISSRMIPQSRYNTLSRHLKSIFGTNVRKISLDARLGCPNRDGTLGREGCIYCNQWGSGAGVYGERLPIEEQVSRGIAGITRRYRCRKFIAYFQSYTNTYASTERLRTLYQSALQHEQVVGLAVGTRPDCVPDQTLELMAELNESTYLWVEYGLQSIHEPTLKLLKRGHGVDAFYSAVRRTREKGIHSVGHLMLGLPEETPEQMIAGALAMAQCGVEGIKIHPMYVIRGTPLEKLYIAGVYRPMTEEQARAVTLEILKVIPPQMVIHRLTSDPHYKELVAPLWMLDRKGVRDRLNAAMEAQHVRQGCALDAKLP